MAGPAFESVGTRLGIAQRTTLSLAAPSGITAGDAIVLFVFLDGSEVTITPPTGFAHHPNSPVVITGVGGEHALAVMAKRADGGETGPFTVTWDGTNRYSEGQAALYNTVVDSGSLWDAADGGDTPSATDTASGTVTPAVNVTTAGADRLLLHAGTNWAGGTWTAGTGFTKRSTGAEDLFFGDKNQAASGNSGSVTATCTGSDKRTAFIASLIGTTGGGGETRRPSNLITPGYAAHRAVW